MTHAEIRRGESRDVVYVYGIVAGGIDVGRAPNGVDDATVRVVSAPDIAALMSGLPRSEYGAESIEKNSGDVAWSHG
jgi:hypothetical protein